MPKRVGVIDLGSNSARLVIFERTSRFGFFILAEHKIKVRLGEGAYENGGVLQPAAMQKCLNAFVEFKELLQKYGAKRVLCVGTSALRDAPNGGEFIKLVFKKTKIAIRKIDGESEAYFGGYAAHNLLSDFKEGVSVDIGGGSTELARIKNGKIEAKISLNLGTVRLKELFFDKGDMGGLYGYVNEAISAVGDEFASSNLIAMGGSARALSNAIMAIENYPIKIVHNYCYDYEKYAPFFSKLIGAKTLELAKFPIKKERYDTIREGAIIFSEIAKKIGAKSVITSGVGVREGVFLGSILHGANLPKNFNPSLKSLQDRFASESSHADKFAKALFSVFFSLHKLEDRYISPLCYAAKLCEIGARLGFYAKHESAASMVLNGLNYRTSHEQKALIAAIIAMHGKPNLSPNFANLSEILPNERTLAWLSFLCEFARILNENALKNLEFKFENLTLQITGAKNKLMLKDSLRKLPKPAVFAINFI
ncbi:Ppx/GppA family phosphatase [Campylobacter sp. VBCF_07 NA4]|uniref:Ppx/GppA phosphatase family protein n=1 Tax=Campylobacter sp. VBCF_07 NA4 TaxID=2983835 RepID=UPI0022E9FCE3|nr:Ppx/GppA phosphatase family protein [Campylobacter sp. VBCF_07 NA4]MDA3055080.1 Ppx/GppA family phosphatase [Campylobacter sp. VBCF_07 NA4]